MSNKIKDLINSQMKPKERVGKIVESIKTDTSLFNEVMEIFRNGYDVEKGTCAEVMKFVSKDNPEFVIPYLDELINNINHKASRVKWGVPESIGNLAKNYPKEVQKAIPRILFLTLHRLRLWAHREPGLRGFPAWLLKYPGVASCREIEY